jgi:hypothetical protein
MMFGETFRLMALSELSKAAKNVDEFNAID